ncbi:MAG: tetratricopeptide repeat protein [Chthoniobacterales bacterium]
MFTGALRLPKSRIIFARGSLQPAGVIFAAAFSARVLALVRLTTSAAFRPSGSDMLFYQQWAERILHGQLTGHAAFYGLPLYAYWLAALYRLFGTSPFVPLLLQALADAGTATLIYKIAKTAFAESSTDGRATALLASIGWIFFVPAAAYSVVLMPTSFGVLAFWFVVWAIVNRRQPLSVVRCLALGLVIGVSAMAVANALITIPLVAAAFVLRRTRPTAIAALVIGVSLGTAPCWLYNRFIAHDAVFLSAHSGVNLWVGNNPEATGYPHFPGLRSGQAEMLGDSIEVAESAAGHSLKRSEVSAYWSAKARSYLAAQPLAWLRLVGRKFGNFWNAFEYDDVGVIAQLQDEGVIWPGVHFGLVAALALAGILVAWQSAPYSRWVVTAILLIVASLLLVFITERYRLLAVPGLLIFVAFGIVRFFTAIRALNWRAAAPYLAGVGLATVLVSVPRHDSALWALVAYNRGRQALDAGDLATAARELARSQQYVPDNPETNFALGNLRLAGGDRAGAQQFYIRTLMLDRRHKGALSNLGVLALDQNNFDTAEMYFRQALSYAPQDSKSHFLLARALFGKGDRQNAATEVKRALELQPTQAEFIALREQIEAASR